MALLTSAAFAQNSGTIAGTVSDIFGGVLSQAAIQARNVATGAVYKTGAAATGAYTLSSLPAGTYELSATVAGMRPYHLRGVMVQAAQTVPVNIRLEDYQNLNTLGDGRAEIAAIESPHNTPPGPAPRMAGKPDLSRVWHGWRIVDPVKPEMTP